MTPETILIMIPAEELEALKLGQQKILEQLAQLNALKAEPPEQKPSFPTYLTVKEFLAAVHIGRWKFDELVARSKIKTIKKKRKIYIPVAEVERFFTDPSVS